jgi:hypothetical protein
MAVATELDAIDVVVGADAAAMVRHFPVLALISITGLLTGAAWVATPVAGSPRMNTPDAARPAGARWKMVMMWLQCGIVGENCSRRISLRKGYELSLGCEAANTSPEVEDPPSIAGRPRTLPALSSRHWMM